MLYHNKETKCFVGPFELCRQLMSLVETVLVHLAFNSTDLMILDISPKPKQNLELDVVVYTCDYSTQEAELEASLYSIGRSKPA